MVDAMHLHTLQSALQFSEGGYLGQRDHDPVRGKSSGVPPYPVTVLEPPEAAMR